MFAVEFLDNTRFWGSGTVVTPLASENPGLKPDICSFLAFLLITMHS